MFDFFKELSKPDPKCERRRLELIRKIVNDMDRDHEREERYYCNEMNALNDFDSYVQSLPDDCPQKSSLNNNIRNIYAIHNKSRTSRNELYYDMRSKLKDEIRNIIVYLNEEETNRKTLAKKLIKESVSIALGFIPILSNAKGMVDAIMGVDLITDEKLSTLNRFYAGVSSLPVIGDILSWENWVMKILEKLFKI